MLNTSLKSKIQKLDEAQLARLSLQETLNLEEALCDTMEPQFMSETADLSMDYSNIAELKGLGEFDRYQRFNQNHLDGIDDEDALELLDPDGKSVDSDGSAMHEAGSAHKDQDVPEDDYMSLLKMDTDKYSGTDDNQQVVGGPDLSKVIAEGKSVVSFLLGESNSDEDCDEDEDFEDMDEEDMDEEDSSFLGSDSEPSEASSKDSEYSVSSFLKD